MIFMQSFKAKDARADSSVKGHETKNDIPMLPIEVLSYIALKRSLGVMSLRVPLGNG
jgi:hypothetical protein